MAGEKKGKAYEAILFVALSNLLTSKKSLGHLFWNETPPGMTIEPDLAIGASIDSLDHVFLITHIGSVNESNRKYWRNLGELFELKTQLKKVPQAYSVYFESKVKDDLLCLDAATLDGQLIIPDMQYGNCIIEWVIENSGQLPVKQLEKAQSIRAAMLLDDSLSMAISLLGKDIEKLIRKKDKCLDHLWHKVRLRRSLPPPKAAPTRLRLGMAKAMLIGEIPKNCESLMRSVPSYVEETGLASKVPGGYRYVDEDLIWLSRSSLSTLNLSALSDSVCSGGYKSQIFKVRNLGVIKAFRKYFLKNYKELITVSGMLSHMRGQRDDPAVGLNLDAGVAPPIHVWLFDFIGAIVKAKSKKAQAFGYSVFSKHVKAAEFKVGNMEIGAWCACFMNQYFSIKKGFKAPEQAEKYVALVLSEILKTISENEIEKLSDDIFASYLSKEYGTNLMAHRGFDPIGAAIESKLAIDVSQLVRVRAGFAERSLNGGSGGATSVLRLGDAIINWQSVSDDGRDHKKKELCGRAIALRYSWSSQKLAFIERPMIAKLILIIDGSWRQSDLDMLAKAGWDHIIYAEHLELLPKLIEQ